MKMVLSLLILSLSATTVMAQPQSTDTVDNYIRSHKWCGRRASTNIPFRLIFDKNILGEFAKSTEYDEKGIDTEKVIHQGAYEFRQGDIQNIKNVLIIFDGSGRKSVERKTTFLSFDRDPATQIVRALVKESGRYLFMCDDTQKLVFPNPS